MTFYKEQTSLESNRECTRLDDNILIKEQVVNSLQNAQNCSNMNERITQSNVVNCVEREEVSQNRLDSQSSSLAHTRDSVISSTSSTIDEYPWLQRSVSELSPSCLGGDPGSCLSHCNDEDFEDDVFADSGTNCSDKDDVSNYQHFINTAKSCGSVSDDQLLTAARESVRCGHLTPMLKVELKYLIQSRRMSEGKDEMEISFEPKEEGQLSPSEVERVERRRRQNRMAAKRFREKRKSTEDSLLKNIQELQELNSRLVDEAKQLRQEKQLLMEIVADHLLVCPYIGQLPVEVIGGDTVS